MSRLKPSVILEASKDPNILTTELIYRVKLESNLVWNLQGAEIYRLRYPSDNVKYLLIIDPSHILSLFTYMVHNSKSIVKLMLSNKIPVSQIHLKLGINNSVINTAEFETNRTRSMDIHPGKILDGYLTRMGYSHQQFSILSSISATSIRNLVLGQQNLTNAMAKRLSNSTDVTYTDWLKLSSAYDKVKRQEVCVHWVG